MSRVSRTGRAAFVYLLLAGLQRGVSLLILPFITHAMSPAQFGAASVLTATALLLVAVIAAPLEQLVFRASARGGDGADSLIRAVGFYCYIALPLIAASAAGPVALFVPEVFGIGGTIWAIELVAIGFQPAATYFALPFVRAHQDIRRFAWLALTSVLVTAASKILFVVVWRLDVLGWALSDLISGLLSALLAIAMVRLPKAKVTTKHIKEMLRFSIPLIPHRASFWALLSLNRPAMAMVSSLSQVGLLSFGLNLAAVATMIIAEIQQAVLPHYSRESLPAPNDETRGPVRWQLMVAVTVPALVGAGLAVAGHWIFSEAYWPSFALTGLLLCGQVAYGLYLVPMNYLVQTAGLPKFSALASLSGAIVILAGIFAFGNRFGAFGVACATALGFVLMSLVALTLTRVLGVTIHWGCWRDSWPELTIGTAGLAFSVAALFLPIGSPAAYSTAVTCVGLVAAALVIASRRAPGGPRQPKHRRA